MKQKNGETHRIRVDRRTFQEEDSEQAQLRERVRELELRLNSVPIAALEIPLSERISEQLNDGPRDIAPKDRGPGVHHGRASSPTAAPTATPGAHTEPRADELTVDTLATAAFNDVPEGSERDIGFFGKQGLSNSYIAYSDIQAPVQIMLCSVLSLSFSHISRVSFLPQDKSLSEILNKAPMGLLNLVPPRHRQETQVKLRREMILMLRMLTLSLETI